MPKPKNNLKKLAKKYLKKPKKLLDKRDDTDRLAASIKLKKGNTPQKDPEKDIVFIPHNYSRGMDEGVPVAQPSKKRRAGYRLTIDME